jgi:hypothetical protein
MRAPHNPVRPRDGAPTSRLVVLLAQHINDLRLQMHRQVSDSPCCVRSQRGSTDAAQFFENPVLIH